MRGERPIGAPDASILVFLQRARRRYLTRELLGAAGASALANIVLGYAVGWANRVFARDLPGVSFGAILFVIFGAAALRRNRSRRVAARADRGLRLQDRLVTFLDFSRRADVDPDFREAQAGETAATLARTDLPRGLPIPRLLWAAPLLFGWMLYVDYFPFFVPFAQIFLNQELLVTVPHRSATRTGEAPEEKEAVPKPAPDALPSPGEENPAAAPGAPAPAAEEEKKPPPGKGPPEGPDSPEGQDAPGGGDPGELPRLASIPAIIGEPARLYSERVGAGLTPVAEDATGSAGAPPAPPPEALLQGRVSFNLVPVDGGADGPAAQGTQPGAGKADGLGITVDYDAIPPEYRHHVRRYFNALARLFQGRTDGT